MTLLDQRMPSFRLHQVDRIAVAAELERTWRTVRQVDLYRLPGARALSALRLLPERDSVLGESASEVVLGFAGKPGFGKVAWSFRADARESGGTWVTVETRVAATDEASRERFRPYWGLIGPFSRWIRRVYLRSLREELGAPVFHEALPGDELLHEARFQRTHTRIIEVPPAKVWPWLLQMGCRRGGWYSYDLLDNGGVRSADHIVAALQDLAPGDTLPATPKDPGGFAVLRVDPPRALVLGSPDLLDGPRKQLWSVPVRITWSFVLEPVGAEATNLVVRVRGELTKPLARIAHVVGPTLLAHEVMERAQLRHLKQRAEAVV